MRVLHCSDIHLGRRPVGPPTSIYSLTRYDDYFKAFEYVVDWAISNRIDLMLICGDLFDKREINPDTLVKTQGLLDRLRVNSIEVIAIEGNHDKSFNVSESWLDFLAQMEYLELLRPAHDGTDFIFPSIDVGGLKVFGLGYPGFMVDDLLGRLAAKLEGRDNMVLVHSAPGKGGILPGLVDVQTLGALADKAFYVAGGHLHSRLSFPAPDPFFFVPGSLEYWDVWEGGEKGFFVLDTSTGEVEFHDSSKRERVELSFEISRADEGREVEDFARSVKFQGGELVLFTVRASGDFSIDPARIENLLESRGALKCFVKIKLTDRPISLEDYRSLTASDIEREVILNSPQWRGFSRRGEARVELIDKLKQYQKEGQYENFRETLDLFLERLVGEKR